MGTSVDVLLVTANVGSLFDNLGEIESNWLREFYKTIHRYKPYFIALHCQEVGGKDYELNISHVEDFINNILSSREMKDFDRACVYVDNDFRMKSCFTALGSMYLIHRSIKQIYQYDFREKEYKAVCGQNIHLGSLDDVPSLEKEKFPKNFWPDFNWSRKGFMRTRWIIHNSGFDLVNVHLFHDASNLIACKSSPSVYSGNREKALRYVINRISDNTYSLLPFFLFGDFNFRLDTQSLVENVCSSGDIQTIQTGSNNEVEKIICEEKENDHKVLLHIESKLFEYVHKAAFHENNGQALLKYDKEINHFQDILTEEEIVFPPSYPYSEDHAKPTQYMNTRCPSWCDRVLMSQSAKILIYREPEEECENNGVAYNTIGSNVCMGDHKPVFLFFRIKTNG
ncbi:inositol polyphosphate-5-phosphatase A isoform X1 [Erpetoichthys calabaricus]|uniref:inositol polyphosphate-5-phosphatase A isoform X1 n=1 Tax=Erpetoichthys calabaricus TaxID=27687 RepID=UPI0022340995|nr:inositol polyphosphate-5-phosphatase A isoform X1 [Erpetoichthys calabaricus]